MLFLLRVFSPDPWNWGPEFLPEIPLPPLLIWFGRAILVYVFLYLISLMQAPIDGFMQLFLD